MTLIKLGRLVEYLGCLFWKESLRALRSSKDIFDFDLVASMRTNEITYVLTHNVSDFAAFSDWLKCIPLIE